MTITRRTINRRQFLESLGMLGFLFLVTPGSLINSYSLPLRPPGAVPEDHFIAKCIRCFKCGQACRAQAITFGSWADGQLADTPLLANLRSNPCTLCMECTNVCPTGALQQIKPDLKLISTTVKIGVAGIDTKRCVVHNGNRPTCHLCKTSCPYEGKALTVDAKNRPVVKQDKCVGCGRCEHFCPVEPPAISVRRIELETSVNS